MIDASHQMRWLVAALAALLLLTSGCASMVAVPLTGTEAPGAPSAEVAALASALPPAGASAWTSYTDPRLGYTISMPQDAEFTSGTSKAGIYTARIQFTLPGAAGYQGMVVRVEPNAQHQGIEQIARDLYRSNLLKEPPADLLQQLQTVTVAGLSGVQMGQGADFSLVVPFEDHVYIFAPVHGEATSETDPQALALFYQILATLRISR